MRCSARELSRDAHDVRGVGAWVGPGQAGESARRAIWTDHHFGKRVVKASVSEPTKAFVRHVVVKAAGGLVKPDRLDPIVMQSQHER